MALTVSPQALSHHSGNPQAALSFCQTAEKMRLFGKMSIIIGMILTIATITGIIYYTRPAINNKQMVTYISVVGGSTAGCSLIFGIVVLKKPYWQDPMYRQEQRNIAHRTMRDEGVRSFHHWAKWRAQGIVTEGEIAVVIENHAIARRNKALQARAANGGRYVYSYRKSP